MRVTIRKNGKILNIIIAENVEIAAALYPGCDASEESVEDKIPEKKETENKT